MNKVKKILTTLMVATLTVSTGVTSMPMLAHNVKAESKAETISRFFPLSIAKKCVEKSLEKLQRNRSFQCI